MGVGIDPVFAIVIVIVFLLVMLVDLIIFCYWFAFKYKEYSYQQMYGPVLKFAPRESDQPTETPDDIAGIVESNSVRTPNTEHRLPEFTTPDSVPAFDFMPPTISEEETESVPSESALPAPNATSNTEYPIPDASEPGGAPLPNTEYLIPDASEPDASQPIAAIPNTQYLIPAATTPNAERSTPTVAQIPNTQYPILNTAADPLDDMRPIDPVLLSAQGGVRSPFAATWSLVHPFIGIQVVLLVVSILQVIFLLPVMFNGGVNAMVSPYGLAVIIISLFIQNAGFVGVTAYLVKGYGTSLKRIGFRAPTGREIALGLAYGTLLCVAAVLMEKALDAGASHVVSKEFMDRMGKLNEALTAGAQFEKIRSIPLQIWFILAGAVAAPIGEEVFFRGLLYNGLKKRWGVAAGVIVSGICFGLIHFAPEAIIIIIPMGCVLAMVYERTKSLWVTILMHAVNNGAQLIVAMYAMNHVAGHK